MNTSPKDLRAPNSQMIAVVDRLANFIAEPDETQLQNIFAESDVTIIENFAPYVFKGRHAVQEWEKQLRNHLGSLSDLRHKFGATHDFSTDSDRAFFSIKTNWSGKVDGVPFKEEGGWAFVLTSQANEWRVQSYSWSVTDMTLEVQEVT